MDTRLRRTGWFLACLAYAGGAFADDAAQHVFVELKAPEPTVVARYEAQRSGRPFDESLHRAAVRLSQDELLERLVARGLDHVVTSSGLVRGGPSAKVEIDVEHRYTDLINAVRLRIRSEDLDSLRSLPGIKHVSVDVPSRLLLDNSVAYVRANGPSSARSLGIRGSGSVNSDGSSSGQVIAVLDTGIDHTNPMFDTQVGDAQFEDRTGDLRSVRLSGSPYVEGTNHPKVGYRYLVGTAPAEGDDTGHGTNTSSTAAGLKARADDILNGAEIVEGVAPGAVLMDYKVCPSLVCVNANVVLALEDCIRPTDDAGFPKPVCTVVNMSLGNEAGDPHSADGIAAGNLVLAGVVSVAAAGNEGPEENIIGSPSAHRRVISVAASTDPGLGANSIDVLQQDPSLRTTPGSPADADQLPDTGTDFLAFISSESNGAAPLATSVAQYYVDIGLGDTPEQVPASVDGRICLAERGSTVDAQETGSGLFGNKAAQCAARGGVALVAYNNEPGQIGVVLAPAEIPVFTISREDGLFLRDTLGFESGDFGAISNEPVRLNPADPSNFVPDTAGFSSRGPNNDFAVVKPDIAAPGVQVLMGASKVGALGSPTGFVAADGTSFASPHIAGMAALVRDDLARPGFTPSLVRAALTNTATHLRDSAGLEIDDDDLNVLIHEVGAGLGDVHAAIMVDAVMGTNTTDGPGGPDSPVDPDFLASHSFGQRAWIGTGQAATSPDQRATVTVTLADLGSGGTYDLSVVDGGALRGDVTRPLDEPGFSMTLSASQVTVPVLGAATFDVTVAVDGQPGGLQIAGTDVTGADATEFLWYVIATRGISELRMPFYLRVVEGTVVANRDPDAGDDNAQTEKETAVTIDVLANDSDPDGDPLEVVDADDPGNGTVEIDPEGTVTYNPNPGFLGNDAFNYTVSDGRGGTAMASVAVNVFDPAGNLPPNPLDDEVSAAESTPIVIHVLANDSDPDGDPLSLGGVGAAGNGSTMAQPDGTVTYDPFPGFNGSDSFTYTACDSEPLCSPATVFVTVGCPPVPTGSFTDDFDPDAEPGWTVDTAANDNPGSPTWAVTADALAQSPPNVFFSDASGLDLKDDRLIAPAQAVSESSLLVFWHRFQFESAFDGGVLEISTNGGAGWQDVLDAGAAFVEGGYNGVIDPGFGSPIAGRAAWTGFSQFIDAMNRVVVDLGALGGQDVLVRWRLVQDPFVPGSLAGEGWRIDDVTFSNTLEPVDPCLLPPNAFDDSAATARDVPVQIDVLANDSDPENDPLSVDSIGQPANGAAMNNFDGTVTYAPDPGFRGSDSFTYTVCDPGFRCDTARVRVEVCAPPDGSPTLTVDLSGTDAVLSWTPLVGAVSYDAVAGDVQALRDNAGDFSTASIECVADSQPETSLTVPDETPPGTGVFFLVRGESCVAGTEGTFDSGESTQTGERDAEIAASGSACP